MKTVSDYLKTGISKSRLSRLLGVNRSTLLRYENDTEGKLHMIYNGRFWTVKGYGNVN